MNIQKPKGWRTGQTIFNFLEWLQKEKGYSVNQNLRMADPFYIEEKKMDELFTEYITEQKLIIGE